MSNVSFAPIVTGHNSACMAQAYFPRAILETILPEHLSIPDDDMMAGFYPETELEADTHPLLLSFCHGSDIHDVYTNVSVPEQEEIMFVFPVCYTHDDGARHLVSYVPVLYLDSLLGMMGGIYFGLRKEYHPGMKHGEQGADARWWSVEGILDASFETRAGEVREKLPPFYEQIFANPFVTVSYPLPFAKMMFYKARVRPDIVRGANVSFSWEYKGVRVKSGDRCSAVYSEYSFSMSRPMNGNQYFGCRRLD